MGETRQPMSTKSFLVSIFKYSIATFVNFFIYGVALLLVSWFVSPDVWGEVDIFISTATLFMNICIIGLDNSFIRFFNEAPQPLDKNTLFGACFGISGIVLALTCVICCVFFPQRILNLFFTSPLNNIYLALLFLNAFMAMIARYVNILYRMDGNIKLYTLESILNQFFSKMFYLLAILFNPTFENLVRWELVGMGGFCLVLIISNRKRITLSPKVLFSAANKELLPYGIALAPTAIMLYLNSLFSKVYIAKTVGEVQAGIFSMVTLLSNVVALVQAGFATFWSAFIYANYKAEQEKIKQVHDYLTFLIVEFLCCILAFEDIIFLILGKQYYSGIEIFPVMLLVPVFSILSETTVYGISIAKKPIYDTIGIALSVISNIALCYLLTPVFDLMGVCLALAGANIIMFLFRTVIAQHFYESIVSVKRTTLVILIMFFITAASCMLADNFVLKLAVNLCVMGIYLFIYRTQLKNAVAFIKETIDGIKNKNTKTV